MNVVAILLLVAMAAMQHTDACNKMINDYTQLMKAYNNAKFSVQKVAGGLDFDAAVNALSRFVNQRMNARTCTAVCIKKAGDVMVMRYIGKADQVCNFLCTGAMIKSRLMALSG